MKIPLADISRFLDNTLEIKNIADYKNALNGLQVENKGSVKKVAVSVDASEYSIREAIACGAEMLIVHHGLFWPGLSPITGAWYRKLSLCIENNLAIYSSHLPLDMHPLYGNNVVMAKDCDMKIVENRGLPFEGNEVGVLCHFDGSLHELASRIYETTGMEVRLHAAQSEESNPGTILLCSGGAGDELPQAIAMGVQTFISGEGSHWTIPMAAEEGVNLIYAGHYATETFGVKALAALLSEKFGIPSEFIDDAPTPFVLPQLL